MDAGPILPQPQAGSRAGAGLTLLLLGVAGFAIGANLRITDPLLPTLAFEFDTTVGAAALVAMFYAVAHGALQIVYGPLGDRHGKLLIVALAALASAVISLASAFAGSLAELAALRMFSGFATAAIVPLTLAYVGDTTAYSERHAALARYTGMIMLGLIAGQVLGGLIADQWGWRAVFYLIAALFALAGAGLMLSPELRAQPRSEAQAKLGYRELFALLKRPAVRAVLAAVGGQGMITFTTTAFVGAYLHDRFGFSLSAIGLMLGMFAAGGLVFTLFTARILARLGERGGLAFGGLLFAACLLTMTLSREWWPFAPAMFLAGFGVMMVHIVFQAHATQMAPEARGAALSLFATMIFFGQTIGFAIMSVVYDLWGGPPVFLIAAIGCPLIAFGFRHTIAKG